ncbi:1-phosphofructokinase [Streptomyces sp. NPDC047000]|uniref:1-phosphofructokinase n=1 Tax=Streptomyces sp. NPDC047000 TaxID=3155474 RepID=UPI00340CF2C9
MIVTITPNPSVDCTFEVAELRRGAVHRAGTDRVDPGGKGVNVSRALGAAGHATTAAMPLGGSSGMLMAELLGRQGIETAPVWVGGETRVNVSVVEPDGVLTKVNAPGPELTADESEALLKTVHGLIGPDTEWLACCGSLPRGLAPEWYAELVASVHDAGARIAVDTSGPALLAALGEGPDLVKPNREELAEAVGRPLTTVGEALEAARELRGLGARQVLASLGADGMLLVSAEGEWYGSAAVTDVRSDVGAGDASLAGFLGAGGAGWRGLVAAVAHGAAAVGLPGSVMPAPADVVPSGVVVTAVLPLDRPLVGRDDRLLAGRGRGRVSSLPERIGKCND